MNADQTAALIIGALAFGWLVLLRYSFAAACLLPLPLLVAYMLVCLALGIPA